VKARKSKARFKLIVTGYSKLKVDKYSRYYKDTKNKWGAVVLDEGHSIKNKEAKTTEFAYELPRQFSFLVTGI